MKVLTLLVVGLLLAADAPKEDPKKDAEKMAGEWTMASGERDGQAIPDEFRTGLKRTVKDDEYIVTKDGETIGKGKFTLDPSKKPKTIDITLSEGEQKGMVIRGIYELDGDTFKICYAQPGVDRPKEFVTKDSAGVSMSVWKRKVK